jgi:hypothetical protein
VYVVNDGDTLYSIATKYGITWQVCKRALPAAAATSAVRQCVGASAGFPWAGARRSEPADPAHTRRPRLAGATLRRLADRPLPRLVPAVPRSYRTLGITAAVSWL